MPRCTWLLGLAAMTASASAQSAHVEADVLFRQGKELMGQKGTEEIRGGMHRVRAQLRA